MRFSVIVPTYRRQELSLCLDALARYFNGLRVGHHQFDVEVLVADDARELR